MSAFGDTTTKKMFFDEGAFEYVEKPFDIEEILSIISKGLNKNTAINIQVTDKFIGDSAEVLDVFNKIEKIKTTNITVLIEGESGTGKDLTANHIHLNSQYSNDLS